MAQKRLQAHLVPCKTTGWEPGRSFAMPVIIRPPVRRVFDRLQDTMIHSQQAVLPACLGPLIVLPDLDGATWQLHRRAIATD